MAAEQQTGNIIFTCKYGSMKSQMAAAYFNKLAAERGLSAKATSRALDTPDATVPDYIRDYMASDGLTPVMEHIRALTPAEAEAADKVLSFDPVSEELGGKAQIIRWTDVPPSKRDYPGAMAVIMRHVEEEIDKLAAATPSSTTAQR